MRVFVGLSDATIAVGPVDRGIRIMGKWNSSDALNIHITVSILSLLLIYTISAGRNVSVALPRIPALIVDGIVLALVIATLVMCFFPDAEYKGRPRLFRVLVILVADLMVLPPAIGIFASACNGRREFWGEDRLPENCQPFDEPVGRAELRNLKKKIIHDEAEPGHAWLGSSACEPLLVGAVNPGEPGEISLRILDLESDEVFFESPKWSAPWSQNEGEVFPFGCHYWINRGRGDKWYVVRCELWFTSQNRHEKLISSRIKVKGSY